MISASPAAGPDEGPSARTSRRPPRRPLADGVPPQRADGTPPRTRAASPPDIVPTQALAHGGTFVRPGAIAWGRAPGGPSAEPDAACEVVEKALTAMAAGGGHACDLLDELARARVWVPLPGGRRPVTDGSSVDLPVVTYLGADFIPCFTSARQLARYAGRRLERASDARRIPHIVVPATALAARLPPGLGLALNPGAEASAPIDPLGVAYLAGDRADEAADARVRVGHPPAEPTALLREVAAGLRRLPGVASASRAWLWVADAGEGLILSVTLDDPGCEDARTAVVRSVEQAVAAAPPAPRHPVDVTFPGEPVPGPDPAAPGTTGPGTTGPDPTAPDTTGPDTTGPDIIDEWIAAHASPFYTRDAR